MTPVYLVEMSGQGDHLRYLVTKETFDWINEGGVMPMSLAKAMVEADIGRDTPEETIAAYPDSMFTGTDADNDRALCICADIEEFDSARELSAFIKKNDMEIAAEWEGYIY